MKVSVLGAGAIGSLFGGLLQARAEDVEVVLVGRGEHARAVGGRGTVRLDVPGGRCEPPVRMTGEVAELAGSDFVLLTTKSQAAEEALRSAAPYLGDAVVVAIQNGVNDELLRRYVPDERLVVAMTAINAAILDPGSVSLQLDGVTIVGRAAGPAHPPVHRAAELLRRSRMWIAESDNMRGVRYNKLTINAVGYASCLSRSNFITEALTYAPWRRRVGRPILEECLAVYRRVGIELAPIPGRPDPDRFLRFVQLLDVPLVGSVVALVARRVYNRRPIVFSLYQDLLLGRKTEVEYINGRIVELARSSGGEAPCNARVCQLAHRLESRRPGSFFTRDEVIAEFTAT